MFFGIGIDKKDRHLPCSVFPAGTMAGKYTNLNNAPVKLSIIVPVLMKIKQ